MGHVCFLFRDLNLIYWRYPRANSRFWGMVFTFFLDGHLERESHDGHEDIMIIRWSRHIQIPSGDYMDNVGKNSNTILHVKSVTTEGWNGRLIITTTVLQRMLEYHCSSDRVSTST